VSLIFCCNNGNVRLFWLMPDWKLYRPGECLFVEVLTAGFCRQGKDQWRWYSEVNTDLCMITDEQVQSEKCLQQEGLPRWSKSTLFWVTGTCSAGLQLPLSRMGRKILPGKCWIMHVGFPDKFPIMIFLPGITEFIIRSGWAEADKICEHMLHLMTRIWISSILSHRRAQITGYSVREDLMRFSVSVRLWKKVKPGPCKGCRFLLLKNWISILPMFTSVKTFPFVNFHYKSFWRKYLSYYIPAFWF